ncbi:MAG: TIGR04255 family protein [Burkholderiales bacterium]|nr:TIGR04255 family protein [Burkholderiales bacterium]
MEKQPIKLQQDPIFEAVFEMRFSIESDQVADLIPGIVFPRLRKDFPKTEALPIAQIPKVIRDQNPELRYQASRRLIGGRLIISLGDRVAAVSCVKPYIGWGEFQPVILRLVGLLREAALIKEVERFSLKYSNMLSGGNPKEQFAHTRFAATLAETNLVEQLTQIRTEFNEGGFVNIVELAANAIAKHPSGSIMNGLLLSIDTICNSPVDFWNNAEVLLKNAHEVEKTIFFRALTKEAINALQPKWGT